MFAPANQQPTKFTNNNPFARGNSQPNIFNNGGG